MTEEGEDWSPPAQFEEYRVVRPLGHGGMGQVMLAEDRLLERLVAIKFIARASPSAAARERFFLEARAAARLSHPNVVAIHRVGEIQRRPFIVSEYVRGQSLDKIPKPVPWRRALALGIDLARGLAAAHRRGVLHRDIKPANAVISEEGTVKLLDFGLAELLPEVPTSSAVDLLDDIAASTDPSDTRWSPVPSGEALAHTVDLEPRPAAPLLLDDTAACLAATVERDAASDGSTVRLVSTTKIVSRANAAPPGERGTT